MCVVCLSSCLYVLFVCTFPNPRASLKCCLSSRSVIYLSLLFVVVVVVIRCLLGLRSWCVGCCCSLSLNLDCHSTYCCVLLL